MVLRSGGLNLSKSLCSLHHRVLISTSPYFQPLSSGYPSENPTVKHRQLAPTVGPLANGRQKNSMAPLDDNSVLEKGTSFRIGSWIFITNGSGGFES